MSKMRSNAPNFSSKGRSHVLRGCFVLQENCISFFPLKRGRLTKVFASNIGSTPELS